MEYAAKSLAWRSIFGAALCFCWTSQSGAQTRATDSRWFPIPETATFETGDTWAHQGQRYRLYGVQSCLRGTFFTNEHGLKRDCGEASLAMLVALIRDLKPLCYTAAQIAGDTTHFVICFAQMASGKSKGSRVDLGMSIVTLGYAVASTSLEGRPVHQAYAEAENLARRSKAGLWAYPDFPEPMSIILRAYSKANASPSTPSQTLPTTR
ncbi:thermonuclease family protein [Methylosinus sp. H3A]|uniref:thermonuclease family protein n=1 Tax=Methylosinus sp. H3A TaxID=2785786 RepID=UPI001FEF835E|nr:thermonuclease family protein [Methylosinus sp. H3A]